MQNVRSAGSNPGTVASRPGIRGSLYAAPVLSVIPPVTGDKQMQIKLYDWPASPFSLKVRSVLEFLTLDYERVPIIQPANWLSVRRRGKIGKAPALEIDGRLIVDSTDIAYELARIVPDSRIIPSDPRERALCHALEDWSDKSLYFYGLYFQWHDPDGRKMVPQAFGRGPLGRVLYWSFLRRILGQLKGHGVSRKPPEHVRSDLTRQLEAIESLVAPNTFLLGDRPYLCDFAVFGQFVYLSRTPHGAREIAKYPSIVGYMSRMKGLRAS